MKTITLSLACLSILLYSCHNEADYKIQHQGKAHHKEHLHGDHGKSNKHMNKNSFEDLAKRFEDKERAQWQKPGLVIEKLGSIKGKKIADIGAGTGYFSFRLAKQEAEVIAIDVDERFQNFIKDKIEKESTSNLTTRLVGYDNPGLEAEEFDALLIVDTYHHFSDKKDYMTHCYKGLKQGGVLMNVDFKYKATPHGPPIDHRVKAEDVKKVLLDVGFTDVKIDQETLEEQYIIIAKK